MKRASSFLEYSPQNSTLGACVAERVEVHAPATGALLGTVEPADLADAAAAARTAQPLWSLVPVASRARYIRRTAVAMLDELDALALKLADETGWPKSHIVRSELLPAVEGLHRLASDGPRALADRRLAPRVALLAGRSTRLVQSPVGVIGLRGPSASPWAEPALEAAAALLAGNAVILAAGAPLAAQRLRQIFLRAGLPGELLTTRPAARGRDRGPLPARARPAAARPPRDAARPRGRAEGSGRRGRPLGRVRRLRAPPRRRGAARHGRGRRARPRRGAARGRGAPEGRRPARGGHRHRPERARRLRPAHDPRRRHRRRPAVHPPERPHAGRRGGARRRHGRPCRRPRRPRRADLRLGPRPLQGRTGLAAAAVGDHVVRPPRPLADGAGGADRPLRRAAPARMARRVGPGDAGGCRSATRRS